MGIPRVPEQVRRAPLLALRAVFASIGRVVMVADRPPSAVVVEEPGSLFRPLEKTGNVRILPAQEPAPVEEPMAAQEAVPAEETVPAPQRVSAQESVAAEEEAQARDLAGGGARLEPPASAVAAEITDAADLPVPNYDALSLASIRARLRLLDLGQLKVLLDYEAANAERAEFLGMFERRIEKLEAGA